MPLRTQEFTQTEFDGIDATKNRVQKNPKTLRDARNLQLTEDKSLTTRDAVELVTDLHEQSVGLYIADGMLRAIVPAGSKGYKALQPSQVVYDPIGTSSGTDFPDREFNSEGILTSGVKRIHNTTTFDPIDAEEGAIGSRSVPYLVVEMADGQVFHHWLRYTLSTPIDQVKSLIPLGFRASPGLVKSNEKIFAPDNDSGFVRYCATGKPDDWRTVDDAGAIRVGRNNASDDAVIALGERDGNVLVYFHGAVQVWSSSPDPNGIQYLASLGGPGTFAVRSLASVGGDIVYLASGGFRSLQAANVAAALDDNTAVGELVEAQIGSPIKPLTDLDPIRNDNSVAIWSPSRSMYMAAVNNDARSGARIYCYKYLPTRNVRGWTYWDIDYPVDYMVEHDGITYFRSDNKLMRFAPKRGVDEANTPIRWRAETHRFGSNYVGAAKFWDRIEVLQIGTSKVGFLFDISSTEPDDSVTIEGSTIESGWVPIEDITPTLGLVFEGEGAWHLEQYQVQFRQARMGAR